MGALWHITNTWAGNWGFNFSVNDRFYKALIGFGQFNLDSTPTIELTCRSETRHGNIRSFSLSSTIESANSFIDYTTVRHIHSLSVSSLIGKCNFLPVFQDIIKIDIDPNAALAGYIDIQPLILCTDNFIIDNIAINLNNNMYILFITV